MSLPAPSRDDTLPPVDASVLSLAQHTTDAIARVVGTGAVPIDPDAEELEELADFHENFVSRNMETYIANARSVSLLSLLRQIVASDEQVVRDFTDHPEWLSQPRRAIAFQRFETALGQLKSQLDAAWSALRTEAAEDPLIAYVVAAVDAPTDEIKRRERVVFQSWRVRRKHSETFRRLAQ